MTKAITINNQIIVGVPNQWQRPSQPGYTTINYNKLPDAVHFEDGWLEVQRPQINPAIERLGSVVEVKETNVITGYTYQIIPFTMSEIKSNAEDEAENIRKIATQEVLIDQVTALVQQYNDENALNHQDLYPFWKFPFYYEPPFKCRYFNKNNELVLYRCLSAIESQEDAPPFLTPLNFVVLSTS